MSLAMIWPGMGDATKRKKTLKFLAMTAVIAISVGVGSSLIQGQLSQNDPLKVCINDKNTQFVISATLELYVDNNEYTVNIQTIRREKVLKLPFGMTLKNQRALVRMSGPNGVMIEDLLPYKGESEWVEIDSDLITFYAADHQDQFDRLEIIDDFSGI